MQFGINKHRSIFSKTDKIAQAHRVSAICGNIWKIYKCLFIPNSMRKSCDYVLIIYMKKYKIAYQNNAEAKHMHQVQK